MRLKDWKARRSGDGITIEGTDVDTGESARVTRAEITPADNHCVARDAEGLEHQLLLG